MAFVAFSDGASTVDCTDGTMGSSCGPGKHFWNTPLVSATGPNTSKNVFANGKALVLEGDPMETHPDGSICTVSPVNHAPVLISFSKTVLANGRGIGRVGDQYSADNGYTHTISSGSADVSCG